MRRGSSLLHLYVKVLFNDTRILSQKNLQNVVYFSMAAHNVPEVALLCIVVYYTKVVAYEAATTTQKTNFSDDHPMLVAVMGTNQPLRTRALEAIQIKATKTKHMKPLPPQGQP